MLILLLILRKHFFVPLSWSGWVGWGYVKILDLDCGVEGGGYSVLFSHLPLLNEVEKKLGFLINFFF